MNNTTIKKSLTVSTEVDNWDGWEEAEPDLDNELVRDTIEANYLWAMEKMN